MLSVTANELQESIDNSPRSARISAESNLDSRRPPSELAASPASASISKASQSQKSYNAKLAEMFNVEAELLPGQTLEQFVLASLDMVVDCPAPLPPSRANKPQSKLINNHGNTNMESEMPCRDTTKVVAEKKPVPPRPTMPQSEQKQAIVTSSANQHLVEPMIIQSSLKDAQSATSTKQPPPVELEKAGPARPPRPIMSDNDKPREMLSNSIERQVAENTAGDSTVSILSPAKVKGSESLLKEVASTAVPPPKPVRGVTAESDVSNQPNDPEKILAARPRPQIASESTAQFSKPMGPKSKASDPAKSVLANTANDGERSSPMPSRPNAFQNELPPTRPAKPEKAQAEIQSPTTDPSTVSDQLPSQARKAFIQDLSAKLSAPATASRSKYGTSPASPVNGNPPESFGSLPRKPDADSSQSSKNADQDASQLGRKPDLPIPSKDVDDSKIPPWKRELDARRVKNSS